MVAQGEAPPVRLCPLRQRWTAGWITALFFLVEILPPEASCGYPQA